MAAQQVHFLHFLKDVITADIINNAVIEVSTSDFREMETYATPMFKVTNKDPLEALQQGLSTVFEKFLINFMEDHLAPWETYCRDTCSKVPDGLVLPEKAEKEVAELRRAIKALEAHVEAKACFMDAIRSASESSSC